MIPAITEPPFYRYNGAELCFMCDSNRYNPFFYCEACKSKKVVAEDAKLEPQVNNGYSAFGA
jgi:hypothetical protein